MAPSRNSVHARALVRAAEILGGVEALGNHLGTSQAQVVLWMNGHQLPPQHIFLRVVDVLCDNNLAEMQNGSAGGSNGKSA